MQLQKQFCVKTNTSLKKKNAKTIDNLIRMLNFRLHFFGLVVVSVLVLGFVIGGDQVAVLWLVSLSVDPRASLATWCMWILHMYALKTNFFE